MTWIKDNRIMVSVAMILRAAQGLIIVLSSIPCRSLLAIIEPREKIRYAGYYDAALAIGESLGPVIGSVLYKLVGFLYIFVIIGCSIFIYIPLMMLCMPKNIDSDQEVTTLIKSSHIASESADISIFKLITNQLIVHC